MEHAAETGFQISQNSFRWDTLPSLRVHCVASLVVLLSSTVKDIQQRCWQFQSCNKNIFPPVMDSHRCFCSSCSRFDLFFPGTAGSDGLVQNCSHVGLLTLRLFMGLAVMTALAVGLWPSALNARYRDVGSIIPFWAQIWMYASPVAYPVSMVSEK